MKAGGSPGLTPGGERAAFGSARNRSLTLAARFTALTLLLGLPMSAEPLRVAVVTRLGQALDEGYARFAARWGQDRIAFTHGDPQAMPVGIDQAEVIFTYNLHAAEAQAIAPRMRALIARGARVYGHWPEGAEKFWGLKQSRAELDVAVEYWSYGGAENMARFFAYLYERAGRTGVTVEPAERVPTVGIYHPRAGRTFATLDEYLRWYQPGEKPRAAVLFYHTAIKNKDLAHIDALIAALEAHGMAAVAVFGWPPTLCEPLLRDMDLVLALNLGFAKPDDAAMLKRVGAHVIQLMTTRQTRAEWAASPHGVRLDQMAIQVAAPECAGADQPMTIGTTERPADGKALVTRPIEERIECAAARAAHWVKLRRAANIDKKIALIYYNDPAGSGNIGASYLNVVPSIARLLERLTAEGYRTGGRTPKADELLRLLERSGRNVEEWQPGELERMATGGGLTLIPMDQYKRWLAKLPAGFQAQVMRDWGAPEKSTIMCVRTRDGKAYFVLPGLRMGNVWVGPQPLRSSMLKSAAMQHNRAVTPPHAYIAAYLWLREVFGADALVHIGRHGTHEFLPGKNTGSSGDDAAEVLLGDVPVPYFYIIDGAAESMTARRRGAATLIGHLTPLLVAGGKQKEFETLRHALEEEERAAKEAPALAGQYRETAQGEVKRLKLDVALDVVAKPWDQVRARVSEYLDEVEESVIPMGLHTIGVAPRAELVQESARELHKTADEKTVEAWIKNLEESPELELRRFVDVLAGRYQPSGPAGDPLRAPAALPSGRALHDFDPSLIPTKEACALGRKLGDELLRNLKARDGEYPEKVSLVLWYGETIRHQGAMECQALWLMGVEPRWNSRGVVDELKLIPDEKLGRPRVDVVMSIAGIYRDGFPDKALLLDRASRMVQQAGDNALRRHTQAAAAELEKKGLKREAAEKAAQARVFGPAPGDYGAGISRLVKQGRKSEMVDAYLQHNNHAYGAPGWGVTTEGALEAALRGNRAVVHSRSTNLYGVVDNDDFFDYAGGLAAATKAANGGRAVPMVVENLRKRGAEKLTDFRAFLSAELQSRTWNPKWIAEMQRAGYGGAREMADQIENLNGWQATAPEQVDGSFWRKTYDVYVADRHGLGLRKFFAQANPAARRALIGRLLKVEREGGVQFTDAERRAMRAEAATPAQPAPAGAGGGEGARRGAAMAVRRRPVRIFEVPHWAPKLEMTEASVGLTLFGLFLLWSLAAGCGHAAGLRVRRAELVTLRSDARDGK